MNAPYGERKLQILKPKFFQLQLLKSFLVNCLARCYCAVSDFFFLFFFQQFTLSKCIDAVMVLGNSHLFMNRTNKLAVIASHTQERYRCFLLVLKFNGGFSIYIS